MYQVTTQQSQEITNALLQAETTISAIINEPCAVILTKPQIFIVHRDTHTFAQSVFEAIKKHTGITPEMLKSATRQRHISCARNIAFKILRESDFKPSFSNIGRLLNRDHATVMNGIPKQCRVSETLRKD